MHVIFIAHCQNGTIRLSGGGSTYGRVEVCVNETWSTICSDLWDYEDASVACSQLGHSPYGISEAFRSTFHILMCFRCYICLWLLH